MDVCKLTGICEAIAPELTGRLKLFIREPDWAFPEDTIALYSFDAPPWARERGATADCVVFASADAATLEVGLHEIAHALPVHPDAPAETRPISGDAILYDRAWSLGPSPNPAPWFGHDDKFIRVLIHLAYRANRLGHLAHIPLTFSSWGYALRSVEAYQHALGDEPARCLGMTFWEIEQTEPPELFARFFKEDTERYWAWKTPALERKRANG